MKYWLVDGGKSVGASEMFEKEGNGPCALMTVETYRLIWLLCDVSKIEARNLEFIFSCHYFPNNEARISID